jgi:hypothetical protein
MASDWKAFRRLSAFEEGDLCDWMGSSLSKVSPLPNLALAAVHSAVHICRR